MELESVMAQGILHMGTRISPGFAFAAILGFASEREGGQAI